MSPEDKANEVALESGGVIEVELESAVGPRVLVWGEVECEAVESAVPAGLEVDWETSPAPLSSTRGGARGFAHPLRAVQLTAVRRRVLQAVHDSGEYGRRLYGQDRNAAWRLLDAGLVFWGTRDGGDVFFETPAGRAALESESDGGK